MKFELTKAQEAKFKVWDKKHTECRGVDGAIGGRLTYSFIPTGLGVIIIIKCSKCNKTLDLTEGNW